MGTMTATGARDTVDSRRIAAVVVGAAATAAVTWGLWSWWGLTIDDAYITFRYSQNLADGHGPVWNPDGDPVQGYTNLLWMLLMAVPASLGLSLTVAAKVAGVAAMAGAVWQTHRAAWSWSGRRGVGLVAAGALLAMVPTYVHAVAGLETMLYALLLLRFVWACTAGRTSGELLATGVLLGLCRPEGFAVAGLGLAYVAWRDRGPVWPVAGLVAAGGLLAGWQWWFYGYPLANTFYVKMLGEGVRGAFRPTAVVMLGFASVALAVGRGKLATRDRWWVIAAMAAAAVPYFVSMLTMDYAMRFAYHLAPLTVAAAAAGFASMAVGRGRMLVAVALLPWPLLGALRIADFDLPSYADRFDAAHVQIGQALANVEGDGMTLAVHDAGVVPYLSGWTTVDLLGLNDEAIAHGATQRERLAAVRPDVLVLSSTVHLDGALGEYERVARVEAASGQPQQVMVHTTVSDDVVDAIRAAIDPRQAGLGSASSK